MSKLDTNYIINLDLIKDRVNSVMNFCLVDVETSDFYLVLYNNGTRIFDKNYTVTLYVVKPNGNFKNIELEPKENLKKYSELSLKEAGTKDLYKVLAMISHDILFDLREKFHSKVAKNSGKRMHYLCMEFLLGRNLKSTLFNLGLDRIYAKILKSINIDIEDVYEVENDAGLGNGGLGRLAACFMDSLATLNLPSLEHSILYEYGLFKQKIVDQ